MCKERHTRFPTCTHTTFLLLPCRRFPSGSTRCPSFRVARADDALPDQLCPDCRPAYRAGLLQKAAKKVGDAGKKQGMPQGSTSGSTAVSTFVEEGPVMIDDDEEEEEEGVIFDGGEDEI